MNPKFKQKLFELNEQLNLIAFEKQVVDKRK